MRMKTKNHDWFLLWGLLILVSFCFIGCKDDDGGEKGTSFDPSKPVVISDFIPKEGGWGSRLLLYGNNFGDDPTKVKVTIGGKEAKVITVTNDNLYCFVPRGADAGNIEVTVLDGRGEELAYGEIDEKFVYKKKMLVSTLVGETDPEILDENKNFEIIDGPWGNCGGLEKMEWLVFDPNNKDRLYVCGGAKTHRIVDFAEETLGSIKFTGEASAATNILSFTNDGQLIVVCNIAQDNKNGLFFFSPESNFQTQVKALPARGCRAAIPHPINGEIYTSRYDKGWIGRYDPVTGDYKMDEIQMPYGDGETLSFTVKPLLSMDESIRFIEDVVRECIMADDMLIIPLARDFIVKRNLMTYYANFTMPESQSKTYDFVMAATGIMGTGGVVL